MAKKRRHRHLDPKFRKELDDLKRRAAETDRLVEIHLLRIERFQRRLREVAGR